MIEHGDIVLLDTMVILEAHRIKCWNALRRAFDLHTVEECMRELQTGNRPRKGKTVVDMDAVGKALTIHKVATLGLAAFDLAIMGLPDVDGGERALLSHALHRKDAWIVSGPDKALIKSLHRLGFKDRYVTLEDLASCSGGSCKGMERAHTNRWLQDFRLNLTLDGH